MPDSPVIPGGRIPERPIPVQERGPLPENASESSGTVERPQEKVAAENTVPVLPVTPVQPVHSDATPELRHKIEEVLADGLDELYVGLDASTKVQFKHVGEETASKISTLVQSAKVQTKKIIELIISWLKIIPGVNKYFLEQEAKIKADKILSLREPKL